MKEKQFQKAVEDIVYNNLQPIFRKFSDELDLDFDEIIYLEAPKIKNCIFIMSRGKSKGKRCGDKALENRYCKKHQQAAFKISSFASSPVTVQKLQKEPKIPKSRQQILELLATAVPQKITTLKKHRFGYIHEESEIIFEPKDDSYIAIGVDGKELKKLSRLETEKCEYMGWRYDYDKVEDV